MFKKESPIEGSIDAGPFVTGGSADGAEIVGDQTAKTVDFPEQPVPSEQSEQPKEDVVDMASEKDPSSEIIEEEPVKSRVAEKEEAVDVESEPMIVEPEKLAEEPVEEVEEVKQAPVSNPATSIEELEAKIGTGTEPEIMAQEGGPEEVDKPEE